MALNPSKAAIIITIFIWKKPLFPYQSHSLVPAQVLDFRSEVALTVGAAGPASGTGNRHAKHVFNCLKPRNVLYLTTAYFKVCQLWGFSELAVSLFEHTHENNCEWLILITSGWGQILGCVDGFLLRRVEELSELGNSQTSCDMKAVLGEGLVCGRLFSHRP